MRFLHYKHKANLVKRDLVVATTNHSVAICISVERATGKLIKKGKVSDGILNMVEMAFRTCDPSFACATHSLPGQMPLIVSIFDQDKELVKKS